MNLNLKLPGIWVKVTLFKTHVINHVMVNQNNKNIDFTYKHFFFEHLYFFQYDRLLLDCNEVYKKQKFSALDIVDSRSNELWSVSYVT